jgi:hypothetical protein
MANCSGSLAVFFSVLDLPETNFAMTDHIPAVSAQLNTQDLCEKFLTLSAAAESLGVPAFAVRRAAKRGLFPSYHLGGRRTLVRLSEVIRAIERMSNRPIA